MRVPGRTQPPAHRAARRRGGSVPKHLSQASLPVGSRGGAAAPLILAPIIYKSCARVTFSAHSTTSHSLNCCFDTKPTALADEQARPAGASGNRLAPLTQPESARAGGGQHSRSARTRAARARTPFRLGPGPPHPDRLRGQTERADWFSGVVCVGARVPASLPCCWPGLVVGCLGLCGPLVCLQVCLVRFRFLIVACRFFVGFLPLVGLRPAR